MMLVSPSYPEDLRRTYVVGGCLRCLSSNKQFLSGLCVIQTPLTDRSGVALRCGLVLCHPVLSEPHP